MNITNDSVTSYINGFYKPLDGFLDKLRKQAENDSVPIILKETESFLGFLIRYSKPARILEIGTAVGYSAIFFARLGADVATVEIDEKMADAARSNISDAGLEDKITVFNGDGETVIKDKLSSAEPFDMIFIDAAKSHYERFLDAALTVCASGSLIISDNVLLKGTTASDEFCKSRRFRTNIKRMRGYLDHLSERDDLDTVILSCGDGLALSRYIK